MSRKETSTNIGLVLKELTFEQRQDFYAITRGFIHMIRRRDGFGTKRISEILEIPEYTVNHLIKRSKSIDASLCLLARRSSRQVDSDRAQIIDRLKDDPYLRIRNVSIDLRIDRSTVKNDIKALRRSGILKLTEFGYQVIE